MSERAGSEQVTITAYPDGPYLLRGAFMLRDELGQRIETSHRIVALCRCGSSQARPFCDGTHRAIGFRAPGSSPATDASLPSEHDVPDGRDVRAEPGVRDVPGEPDLTTHNGETRRR